MAKKKNSGIAVFIIIIAITVFWTAFNFAKPYLKEKMNFSLHGVSFSVTEGTVLSSLPHSRYIARLVIKGTIQEANATYNQQWLLHTIAVLKNDKNNAGIILFINSPGGTVYEADEAYLALLDYKSSGKPVYAYFGSMAASGGYYIGCAADRIYANRNSITGSIGVISGQSIDLTELMDNIGVKSKTIHAGKNKNMGNYNEPLSAEQEKIMQDMADECYEQFTAIVAKSRNMDLSKVEKLADGRVYTAKQAMSNGLIDKVGNFNDCVLEMRYSKLDGEDPKIITLQYEKQPTMMEKFLAASKTFSSEAKSPLPDAVDRLTVPKFNGPAYYCEY